MLLYISPNMAMISNHFISFYQSLWAYITNPSFFKFFLFIWRYVKRFICSWHNFSWDNTIILNPFINFSSRIRSSMQLQLIIFTSYRWFIVLTKPTRDMLLIFFNIISFSKMLSKLGYITNGCFVHLFVSLNTTFSHGSGIATTVAL